MLNLKEKLKNEIEDIPDEVIPEIYRIINLLKSDFISKVKKIKSRGSLKGIWEGSKIDDILIVEAEKSLFPYEYKGKN